MKRILYIVHQPPGVLADEMTDMMLVSGVFEQPTSVLFADCGAHQLLAPDARESLVDNLAAYGVKDIYVSAESMRRLGLDMANIPANVLAVSGREVRELIARHDVILTD